MFRSALHRSDITGIDTPLYALRCSSHGSRADPAYSVQMPCTVYRLFLDTEVWAVVDVSDCPNEQDLSIILTGLAPAFLHDNVAIVHFFVERLPDVRKRPLVTV